MLATNYTPQRSHAHPLARVQIVMAVAILYQSMASVGSGGMQILKAQLHGSGSTRATKWYGLRDAHIWAHAHDEITKRTYR